MLLNINISPDITVTLEELQYIISEWVSYLCKEGGGNGERAPKVWPVLLEPHYINKE